MGAQHENELAPWADNWGERFHAAGHDFLARIAAVLPSITNHAGVMHLSMTPELCNLPPRYRGFQPAQLTGVATVLFVVEISTASIAGGNSSHAGHLRSRAPPRRRRDGAPSDLVMVVRSCRGPFDQLFAIGAGDPSNAFARCSLGAAGNELRILRRIHYGGAIASTTLH